MKFMGLIIFKFHQVVPFNWRVQTTLRSQSHYNYDQFSSYTWQTSSIFLGTLVLTFSEVEKFYEAIIDCKQGI